MLAKLPWVKFCCFSRHTSSGQISSGCSPKSTVVHCCPLLPALHTLLRNHLDLLLEDKPLLNIVPSVSILPLIICSVLWNLKSFWLLLRLVCYCSCPSNCSSLPLLFVYTESCYDSGCGSGNNLDTWKVEFDLSLIILTIDVSCELKETEWCV